VTEDHITSRAHINRVKCYEEDKNFQAEEPNAEAKVVWDEWLRQRPSRGMALRAKCPGIEDANSTAAAASAPSSMPQRSGAILYATPIGGPDPAWGDPTYFQFSQKEGWWWCKVCEKWSDDGHVKSKKHLNKVYYLIKEKQARENRVARAAREAQSDNEEEARAAAEKTALDPWGPDWKKERRKQNRAKSAKGWRSRNDDGNGGYGSSASSNQVPPPWRKEWSDLRNRYYYWNPETDETTWEIPKRGLNPATSFWS
jgi:hypothetical protein